MSASERRPEIVRQRAPRAARLCVRFALLLGLVAAASSGRGAPDRLEIELPQPLLRGVDLSTAVTIRAVDAQGATDETARGEVVVAGLRRGDQRLEEAGSLANGVLRLEGVTVVADEVTARLVGSELVGSVRPRRLPGVVTLLPALVAIVLAVLTRNVLISLFCGVWLGAGLVHGANPLSALLRTADTYLVGALGDLDHAHIILFSLSLAGMVGVITRTGGVKGIVELVARRAKSARSGQLATWLLGTLIFFDDYANSLIVGNTMRPFTDRVRVSREKLSFIVDATAAPVATIGVISTWTAYQLGLLADLEQPARDAIGQPYIFFLQSIPFSFYSFLALLLVLLSGLTLRDFGPMRRAEQRCRRTGAVIGSGAKPLVDPALDSLGDQDDRAGVWWLAAVPVVGVVVFTLLGLWVTGSAAARSAGIESPALHDIVGNADSYRALLWGSLGASLLAIALGRLRGNRVGDLLDSWVQGAKSLVLAMMILLLAWSISAVSKELRTGDFVAALTSGVLDPAWLPAVAFVAAGTIAFATGTSYGTMGILVPIFVPLAFHLAEGDAAALSFVPLAALSAILGGAVFGDHCSPISDTTVLSSMAAGSDHVDHVRTQLPYAVLVAIVSLAGYVAAGYGVSPLVVLPVAAVVLVAAFLALARRVSDQPSSADETLDEQM